MTVFDAEVPVALLLSDASSSSSVTTFADVLERDFIEREDFFGAGLDSSTCSE
jgi:hypothetical protein